MQTIIVKLQNFLLWFCLFTGISFMCFSCSSSDDRNENEELWTPVDREIIDKYEDSRVLMGTVWGWKKSNQEYDGQHYVWLYADKTCRYIWTVGNNDFLREGVWEYNPKVNRLITTTDFPKLTLKIFSPRDMSGYTDDGKLINVTIPDTPNSSASKNMKFRNDDITFDFLVGKWENKSTGAILIIHANGEYQIRSQGIVDKGVIDRWGGLVSWPNNIETLSLKDHKAMGIGVFSGSLIEVYYATNIRIDGGELLYNDIEELSGSYEYVNVD